MGRVLRDGAPAVRQPTAVATRAGPHDVRGASLGLRGPRGAGTPGPQRPPAGGGHVAATHQGPSAENGPGCIAAAFASRGPSAGMAKSLLPLGGFKCVAARAARHRRCGWPSVHVTGSHPVPPVCSGAPSTASSGLKRTWQHKRCGRGCSPHTRAASLAAQGSPSAHKQPRSLSPSPVRVTRRARPAQHKCARRAEEPSALAPCDSRGGGGVHSLSGSGMLNERGGLRQSFPPSPLPQGGTAGQGGAHGERLQASTGRAPGRTHTHGGGTTAYTSPPSLPRAGGYLWGHLPPAVGSAGGVICYRGGGGGGAGDVGRHPPPSLGGRRVGGRGGDLRSTGGAGPTPPPQGRCNQGSFSPPSPSQKRAQQVGGKRIGQPRRPMQTLCDEHRAPACKSCKGHRGGAALL